LLPSSRRCSGVRRAKPRGAHSASDPISLSIRRPFRFSRSRRGGGERPRRLQRVCRRRGAGPRTRGKIERVEVSVFSILRELHKGASVRGASDVSTMHTMAPPCAARGLSCSSPMHSRAHPWSRRSRIRARGTPRSAGVASASFQSRSSVAKNARARLSSSNSSRTMTNAGSSMGW
jgi:hypothetical protein